MDKKKIAEQLDVITKQGRTEYNDMLPFIKLADVHQLYLDYGYKSLN